MDGYHIKPSSCDMTLEETPLEESYPKMVIFGFSLRYKSIDKERSGCLCMRLGMALSLRSP